MTDSIAAHAPVQPSPAAPAPGVHPDAFRGDIEGLRGLAVLMVVLFHVRLPGAGGGFIGVDVFFVLSGYLITGLLVREMERDGRIRLLHFYARRARRLLPAAALVIVATMVAGTVALSPLDQPQQARFALAAIFYLSNVRFQRATDYFAVDADESPFLHTWSLGLEEQFYLVWPLLVGGVLLWRRDRAALLRVLGVVSVLSLTAALWLTFERRPLAFFAMPPRIWEFGVGAMAGIWLPRRALPWRVLGWLGLAVLIGCAAGYSWRTPFPGWAAVPPVLATAAVLTAGAAPGAGGAGRALAHPGLRYLGRVSYSWYLWHWPFLVLPRAMLGDLSLPDRLGLGLLSLVAAALTYRLVEQPVRENAALRSRPGVTLAAAAALTLCCAGGAGFWYLHGKRLIASPLHAPLAEAIRERSALYRDRCGSGARDARLRECWYGAPAGDTTVVLLGDSHAAQWFSALERIALQRGWRLTALVKSACPAARVAVHNPGVGGVEDECAEWRDAALRRIRELRPEYVVIGTYAGYVRGPGKVGGYSSLTPREWEAGMRAVLQALDSTGTHTLLMRDSPRPGFRVPACLSRARHLGQDARRCTFPRGTGLDSAVAEAERRAARGLAGVRVVDLSREICPGARCQPVRDGRVIYADGNHLTTGFVLTLADSLQARAFSPRPGVPPAGRHM